MSTKHVPDFVVVGAARSGTTALWQALGRHPEIFTYLPKEAHHHLFAAQPPSFTGPGDDILSRQVVTDAAAYAEGYHGRRPGQIAGEAGVYYLHQREGLERLATASPEVRAIALLRDPTDRAFSSWAHLRRDDRETEGDPLRAMELGADRVANGWEWIWDYVALSLYADAVTDLHDLVGKDRTLLVRYDDLVDRPDAVVSEVCTFLGVDPSLATAPPERVNTGGTPRSGRLHEFLTRPNGLKDTLRPLVPDRLVQRTYRVAMARNVEPIGQPPELRRALAPQFASDISRLETVTGWDLEAWRTVVHAV